MLNYFVRVTCDVYCTWSKHAPRYRAYVNDELFTERTWIWQHTYLEETFQILAPIGKYRIHYELVDHKRAELVVRNYRVELDPGWQKLGISAPAVIDQFGELVIQDALD